MKYLYLLLSLLTTQSIAVNAQDEVIKKLKVESAKNVKVEADTSKWIWKKGGIINLNLSQASLKNWAAGGDEFAMSLTTYFNYFLLYRQGKKSWDNSIDFNLGYVQTTSLGSRKNDDRLDVLSKYGYAVKPKWYLTGLFNFRTQFFDGYTYTKPDPEFASSFLSPAYLLLSAGIDYKPNTEFSAFISPATSRFVIVANKELSARGLYGVTPGENFLYELGAFASLNYNKSVVKNVSYKAKLDLFSNYLRKPKNIDLYMTNYLTFKVNSFLSASYNLDLIYDDDVRLFGDNQNSAGLQVKSVMGIGILVRFK
jgi:hypothetical protein